MITRWMDTFTAFAHLPDELAFANHTLYQFINNVGGHDMVEGVPRRLMVPSCLAPRAAQGPKEDAA
jgi:hypothetical protein